jgi:L-glutamine-phosphate cytidylyltransferase
MKAIILAAGEGSRLRPYTNHKPKCMVEVGGKSILDWQVTKMNDIGINDISVITGYKNELVKAEGIKKYVNTKWDVTNMVFTLWCAENEIVDEVIISYGDIIFTKSVLKNIYESENDISVVVDKAWRTQWEMRFDDPLSDAETLIFDDKNRILNIGQKPKTYDEVQAQYIGLMKFKGNGIQRLKESYKNAVKMARKCNKPWGLDKDIRNVYMTDLLQGMIDEGIEVHCVPIDAGWFEIDSANDYLLVNDLLKSGTSDDALLLG